MPLPTRNLRVGRVRPTFVSSLHCYWPKHAAIARGLRSVTCYSRRPLTIATVETLCGYLWAVVVLRTGAITPNDAVHSSNKLAHACHVLHSPGASAHHTYLQKKQRSRDCRTTQDIPGDRQKVYKREGEWLWRKAQARANDSRHAESSDVMTHSSNCRH